MKDSFRSSKAKMIEKPEFTGVNEDFEIIFNAAGAENMNRAKVSHYQCVRFVNTDPGLSATIQRLTCKI